MLIKKTVGLGISDREIRAWFPHTPSFGVDVAGRQRFENTATGNSPVAWTLAIDPTQLGSQPFQVADFLFDVFQVFRRYPVNVGAGSLFLNGEPQELAHLIERET